MGKFVPVLEFCQRTRGKRMRRLWRAFSCGSHCDGIWKQRAAKRRLDK